MIQRVTHIILAFSIFFSSTGFVLNKHFCQDELKSVAVFFKAEACHVQKAMKNCPMHAAMGHSASKEAKGCCEDSSDYVKSETDQLNIQPTIDLQFDPVLMNVLLVAFNVPLNTFDKKAIHYLNYKPPLILVDLPVRFQTFRC